MAAHQTVLQVRVTGRVQGVGFRWWTRAEAERLGLTGWVRNLPDGSVAAGFRGPAPAVEAMRVALATGPRGAVVAAVEVAPFPDADLPAEGFRILR